MTITGACFGSAIAQQSYKITDLDTTKSSENFIMVMALLNEGWAENMDGFVSPPVTSTFMTIANGRAVIGINGFNTDPGTLGGKNNCTNYGGINDRGQAVGLAETSVPDPDGEDMCGFGTNLRVVRFIGDTAQDGFPDAGRK